MLHAAILPALLVPSLLPPAAQPVKLSSGLAGQLQRPQPALNARSLSLIDHAALGAFRFVLQRESGIAHPAEPGFDGMLRELRDYQRRTSVTEQIACSLSCQETLGGPIPAAFKAIWSRTEWAPAILAWFTKLLLPFLVGDMELTQRAPGDPRAGGVRIERCRVLDESGCSGLCLNMCKRPTEQFFAESWGTPVAMHPNLETGECQLSFGVVPLPLDDDPSIAKGCLAGCPLSLQKEHDLSEGDLTNGGSGGLSQGGLSQGGLSQGGLNQGECNAYGSSRGDGGDAGDGGLLKLRGGLRQFGSPQSAVRQSVLRPVRLPRTARAAAPTMMSARASLDGGAGAGIVEELDQELAARAPAASSAALTSFATGTAPGGGERGARFSAAEWHRSRRREILEAHPSVRALIGSDDWVLSLGLLILPAFAWVVWHSPEMSPAERIFHLWGVGSLRSTWAVYCSHAISHGRWSSLVKSYGSNTFNAALVLANIGTLFGVYPNYWLVRARAALIPRAYLCVATSALRPLP